MGGAFYIFFGAFFHLVLFQESDPLPVKPEETNNLTNTKDNVPMNKLPVFKPS